MKARFELNTRRLYTNITDICTGQFNVRILAPNKTEARFKRRILHAPNAIQTMHNEEAYLIIYCLNCIRCMQNSTFETGLIVSINIRTLLYTFKEQNIPLNYTISDWNTTNLLF